jgi:anti-sigma regulatory factor (Ser/Thr protein kinase)
MHSHAGPLPATVRTFSQLLSSTRRGARLARLLAAEQLRSWEATDAVTERAGQIVAELAANAVLHGRVQGRDFRLALAWEPIPEAGCVTLRVEVTDARGDRLPTLDARRCTGEESGRGMPIVAALADRWGTEPYPPGGKTVWAEIGGRYIGAADGARADNRQPGTARTPDRSRSAGSARWAGGQAVGVQGELGGEAVVGVAQAAVEGAFGAGEAGGDGAVVQVHAGGGLA